MTCKHAQTGCNYPESECLGVCHAIRDARIKAGLTQAQAARVCYVNLRTWTRWESGESAMPRATWELFTIRTEAPVDIEPVDPLI